MFPMLSLGFEFKIDFKIWFPGGALFANIVGKKGMDFGSEIFLDSNSRSATYQLWELGQID